MERVTISVNGVSHMLSQGQDIAKIKNDILTTVRGGGGFVNVTVFGNRSLDILVTPGLSLTVESETVDFDPRDDGNLDAHFDTAGLDDYSTEV
jgi:hypothetical protein